MAQLREKVDEQTLEALEELADVVIIVALVDLAMILKNLLWSTSGYTTKNNADIPLCEKSTPNAHTEQPPPSSQEAVNCLSPNHDAIRNIANGIENFN